MRWRRPAVVSAVVVVLVAAVAFELWSRPGSPDEPETAQTSPPMSPSPSLGEEARDLDSLFFCPPWAEFAAYGGVFYPPDYPGTPPRSIQPDRCFRTEDDAQAAGYELAQAEADILMGGAVLYWAGVSTDPYGSSAPSGFGVATADAAGKLVTTEVEGEEWSTPLWLDSERIAVRRTVAVENPVTGALLDVPVWHIFRFSEGVLTAEGPIPIPAPVSVFEPSPDRIAIAFETVAWNRDGYAAGRAVMVQRWDGTGRRRVATGHLAGWSPDGRLLFWPSADQDLWALDLSTGRKTPLLSGADVAAHAGVAGPAGVSRPVWSADGRFLAAQVYLAWPEDSGVFSAILLARADGRFIRLIRSEYVISIFAWSPAGHRLAYSTSGFPSPHDLWVVDEPERKAGRVFRNEDHFDWITWSPDGKWALIDDENDHRWRVLDPSDQSHEQELPRLGGSPLWCCPQNGFASGTY